MWLEDDGISPSNWEPCWRATRDGFAASDFHSGCDARGATVTVIRSTDGYIFGGYSDVDWSGDRGWVTSNDAFLFLLNSAGLGQTPFKARVFQNHANAVYVSSSFGPTFGGGHDLLVSSDSNQNTDSNTNWGYTYNLPSGFTYSTTQAKEMAAGTYTFQITEIEVFAQSSKK